MTYIKICGLKSVEDALGAAEAGADYIGLVFAKSPREVTPDTAAKITTALKKNHEQAKSVGVFVNTPLATLKKIADTCQLDWLQLSGEETLEYCRLLTFPFIKAIHLSNGESAEKAMIQITNIEKTLADKKYMIMLDAAAKDKYGGTGKTFDWESAKPLAVKHKVIIAGGLIPENVGVAIKTLKPWGVDVSTGVETEGKKDMKKIINFIAAVREADDSQT